MSASPPGNDREPSGRGLPGLYARIFGTRIDQSRIAPYLAPALFLMCLALVYLNSLFVGIDSEHSVIVTIRSGVRFLIPALLGLGFVPFFLLKKFGAPLLSRAEHLRLIAAFRTIGISYLLLVVADILLVLSYGSHISILGRWRETAIDVFLAWFVIDIMVYSFWLNAIDFEAFRNLSVTSAAAVAAGATTSFKLLDSIDLRILGAVDRSGGELSHVLLANESIAERELTARLKKLVLLRYVDFYRDWLVHRFSLTAAGQDVLNLPSSLFATTIDDPEVIRSLAEIKFLLSREQNAEVVVACTKLLERVLKQRLRAADPALASIGGKPFDRATLGELVGHASRLGILARFEDHILNAINQLRSQRVVHAGEDGPTRVRVDDAFFVYTLTELGMKALFAEKIDGPGPRR